MGGTGSAGASWVRRGRREERGARAQVMQSCGVRGGTLDCLGEMRRYWSILTGNNML